jgi:hypothetical protein
MDQRSLDGFISMVYLARPRGVVGIQLDAVGLIGRGYKISFFLQCLCQDLSTKNGCVQFLSFLKSLDGLNGGIEGLGVGGSWK